jgi:hypothetical protein
MQHENVENVALLGYGLLDVQVGNWVASDDVASFTYIHHPEQDQRRYARELLLVLDKRFASGEAEIIWQKIENYRENLARIYGPPDAAIGRVSFEKAARQWYAEYGLQFEKMWYLTAPLDLHLIRAGREQITGRWLHWLHPDFAYFIEAGLSWRTILKAIHESQFGGWVATLRMLRQHDDTAKKAFWMRLGAYMANFDLTAGQGRQAILEIEIHQAWMQTTQNRTVNSAEATIDYFRRLELGRLGSQVITETAIQAG